MVQVILGNMRVCLVPYLPEPGVVAKKWQALARNKYDSGWSGDIKAGGV